MTANSTEYRDLLHVVVETTGAILPEGFNSWGLKSVHPDRATTHGFLWALPGELNVSNDNLDPKNTSPRPTRPGDGLCVAKTWRGMASNGIPARTPLLVAYRDADVVGRDEHDGILRIGGVVASVALVDGERLIREHGRGADLRGADLRGAKLHGADLRGAKLRGAKLWNASLEGANLEGADLRGAKLHGADLRGAKLRGADLWNASLQYASLQDTSLEDASLEDANLRDANLRGADLRGADLRGAKLRGAKLHGADLRGAKLRGADLKGANLQDLAR